MSRLFYLSDDQREAIRPHLPPDKGRKPRIDDRRIICGIFPRSVIGMPLDRCAGGIQRSHHALQPL